MPHPREALLSSLRIDIATPATRNRVSPTKSELAMDHQPQHSVNDENANDLALLARVAQRDQQAMAELYDRFARILFSVSLRILKDETRAEEVLQEVFLQIWERASTYDARLGKPLTWAVILTRNKAIDHLRSMRREDRLLDTFKDLAEHTGSPAEPLQQVAAHELAITMKQALRELPAEQRCAIELAFFQGLTQSEIAAELKQPLGTIKARIRRGMLQLRSSLENPQVVCES